MKVGAPARRWFVVAAGLIGVGVASAGVVAAAPAEAAGKGHDWSKVAQCESGGDWSINTGGKYYGGLQFDAESWKAAGGEQYAPRADLATPEQQQATAEVLLAQQGVGSWPTCGRYLKDGASSSASPSSSSSSHSPARASPSAESPPVEQSTSSPGDPSTGNRGRVIAPWRATQPAGSTKPAPEQTPTPSASPESAPPSQPAGGGAAAAAAALAQVGTPYRWAGAEPGGFDCSGLAMYAWDKAGVKLPHSSRKQSEQGTPVSSPDALQPGDLVFYYSPVSHVAIYVGNGQVVHAPTFGDVVKVVALTEPGKPGPMRRPG